ncbi:MAG: hypothetical protein RID93_37100 [Sandaracinaceae bacterium]
MSRLLVPLAALLAVLAPEHASAQRHADRVPDLHEGVLSQLVLGQQRAVSRCARETDSSAHLAEVRVRVSPGAAPATLYSSPIRVVVRSRGRDGALEACVRRAVHAALRRAPYAVPRTVRARHTFQIEGRPEPPLPRHATPYSEAEIQRALTARGRALQRCLGVAGLPEEATLRVAVEPSGRLVLTSATLPSGADRDALSCLNRVITRIRGRGAPARRETVVHRLGVRKR